MDNPLVITIVVDTNGKLAVTASQIVTDMEFKIASNALMDVLKGVNDAWLKAREHNNGQQDGN